MVNSPPKQLMNGLISFEEAHLLSKKIYPLGDQMNDICEELHRAGYGMSAKVRRVSYEELAETETALAQLHDYWRDYAKERLAGLVGPMSILKGRYPEHCAFRSKLIEGLREDAKNGKLKSTGRIVSPQIEPTIKRRLEMQSDVLIRDVFEKSNAAKKQAVLDLQLKDNPDFPTFSASAKYNLLIERYKEALIPFGFKMDTRRKSGAVFRKITSDGKWAFLLIDDSWDAADTGGGLSPSIALTLPRKAVLPEYPSLSSVATFMLDDIVPQFHSCYGFSKNSYQEFCLAIDSIAALTKIIFTRLDKLLTESVVP